MAAYDFNALGKELKDKGLVIAEDVAMEVVDAVLNFVEKGALESENKFDDVLVAVIPLVKKYLKEDVLDKIDGVDDLPSA